MLQSIKWKCFKPENEVDNVGHQSVAIYPCAFCQRVWTLHLTFEFATYKQKIIIKLNKLHFSNLQKAFKQNFFFTKY